MEQLKIPEFSANDIPTTIAQYRIALLRGLLDPEELETHVASQARKLCQDLFHLGKNLPIPDFWHFNPATRALAPQAIQDDPNQRMILIELLEKSPLLEILRNDIGVEAEIDGGRLRHQMIDHINHPLHQDLMFHHSPSFLTMWLPVVERSIRTNIDCPGLRLFFPPVDRALAFKTEQPPEVCGEDLKHFQIGAEMADDFEYPVLETGDCLVFRESVPHASSIPTSATMPRTSFDFRIKLPFERFEHVDFLETTQVS
ncbi:hypothetical protein SCOR_18965 [Sulfidibacter corallicola]